MNAVRLIQYNVCIWIYSLSFELVLNVFHVVDINLVRNHTVMVPRLLFIFNSYNINTFVTVGFGSCSALVVFLNLKFL